MAYIPGPTWFLLYRQQKKLHHYTRQNPPVCVTIFLPWSSACKEKPWSWGLLFNGGASNFRRGRIRWDHGSVPCRPLFFNTATLPKITMSFGFLMKCSKLERIGLTIKIPIQQYLFKKKINRVAPLVGDPSSLLTPPLILINTPWQLGNEELMDYWIAMVFVGHPRLCRVCQTL